MPTAFVVAHDAGTVVHDGIPFLIKIGELQHQHNLAIMSYTSSAGEEPPLHVHPSEHEIFYVLTGSVTFTCGDETLQAAPGSLVFLPVNQPHTYAIAPGSPAHFLVITVPAEPTYPQGWGGFIGELERTST